MCGILLIAGEGADSPEAVTRAEAALDAMAARGPDARHLHPGPRFLAGHLRLAIQDPVPEADQPMWDDDERTVLVFNGEIYNPGDLRAELTAGGERLRTRCDTELLLRALVRFGVDGALDRIRGMYAFVWYDTLTGGVVAARDEVGQKPLYWRRLGQRLALASSIPAILALGGPPAPDPTSYALYFATAGFTAEDRTFFDDVRCVPAGHVLEWSGRGSVSLRRRFAPWDLLDDGGERRSPEERIDDLHEALEASVRRHLVGDVPMGVLLSGGVDSALVWRYARDAQPDLTALTKLSPGIEEIPEEVVPRLLSDRPAPWVRVQTQATDYLDGMAEFIAWSGQPSRWGGGPPMTKLAEAARDRGVKVLLGGDGADEFLGGYITYDRRFDMWGGDLFEFGELLRSAPAGCLYDEVDVAPWYDRQTSQRQEILDALGPGISPIDRYVSASLLHDSAVFLQCCNLPHSDAWSMAASTELRNPLLDLEVLRVGFNLPVADRRAPRKGALRALARRELGDWVDRPKEGTRNYSRAVSDPEYWRRDRFRIGELREIPDDPHRGEMFKLLNLELFHRRFFLGDDDPWEELMTDTGVQALRRQEIQA